MNGQGLQPDTFPGDGFRGGVIDLAGNGGDGNHALLWVIFTLLLIVLVVTLVSLFLNEYRRTQEAHADGPPPTDEHEAPTQVVDLQPESPQADMQAASAQADEQPAPAGGDALAVLDTRYAAGEVTRRGHLRIRKDILAPEAVPS
jgi:uncharacterized membrane protein